MAQKGFTLIELMIATMKAAGVNTSIVSKTAR